jgi:two-component system chemotaxis response regulator CheY
MGEFKDKQILIVDDSSKMRRIMRLTLSRCGLSNVDEGENGVQGLAKAAAKQYDLVITDWNMPEMDGLEMTKALRKLPNYEKVPIMMVTTEGGKQEVIEALMQGVNSYIVKPFTEQILAEKLKGIFGS